MRGPDVSASESVESTAVYRILLLELLACLYQLISTGDGRLRESLEKRMKKRSDRTGVALPAISPSIHPHKSPRKKT